jgi:hypothetical protein
MIIFFPSPYIRLHRLLCKILTGKIKIIINIMQLFHPQNGLVKQED